MHAGVLVSLCPCVLVSLCPCLLVCLITCVLCAWWYVCGVCLVMCDVVFQVGQAHRLLATLKRELDDVVKGWSRRQARSTLSSIGHVVEAVTEALLAIQRLRQGLLPTKGAGPQPAPLVADFVLSALRSPPAPDTLPTVWLARQLSAAECACLEQLRSTTREPVQARDVTM